MTAPTIPLVEQPLRPLGRARATLKGRQSDEAALREVRGIARGDERVVDGEGVIAVRASEADTRAREVAANPIPSRGATTDAEARALEVATRAMPSSVTVRGSTRPRPTCSATSTRGS